MKEGGLTGFNEGKDLKIRALKSTKGANSIEE